MIRTLLRGDSREQVRCGLLVVDHLALFETSASKGDGSFKINKDGTDYDYSDFYVANIKSMRVLFQNATRPDSQ